MIITATKSNELFDSIMMIWYNEDDDDDDDQNRLKHNDNIEDYKTKTNETIPTETTGQQQDRKAIS